MSSETSSETSSELSPTERTTIKRGRARSRSDRAELVDVLASARICHLGVTVDGTVRVLPTVYGVDFDGPDLDGTLYLHGSVAARSLVQAPDLEICVTVTVLDGLVLARSGFNHSMNYRSAVLLGRPRVVTEDAELGRALDAIVDQVVEGRSKHLRSHTKKELAATVVLALPLYEASVKARSGGPEDDDRDVAAGGVWAGVVPVSECLGESIAADDLTPEIAVPQHVLALSGGR
ncbi:pyridoxamine 5'-phosphate oxidase family protein [Rhodococcus sp. P1Y]|uniref:pyridoxamine 5'-phosphate oxidase family protein n=1 Tax=Rhodococcus sp. P1Y TaxID=1302308 RepID=UPI001F259178|nr:pyridoxamine 5'-phosphate oxidase family protein [Rhodococcus sp. P1Y]